MTSTSATPINQSSSIIPRLEVSPVLLPPKGSLDDDVIMSMKGEGEGVAGLSPSSPALDDFMSIPSPRKSIIDETLSLSQKQLESKKRQRMG